MKKPLKVSRLFASAVFVTSLLGSAFAQEFPGLSVNSIPRPGNTNGISVTLDPVFGADQLTLLSSTNPGGLFTNVSAALGFYGWNSGTNFNTNASGFFKVQVSRLSPARQWAAAVLNRMCYGPTPEELFTLMGTNPNFYYLPGTTNEAYISNAVLSFISNQLNPASISENLNLMNTNFSELTNRMAGLGDFVRTNENTGRGTANLQELRAWYTLNAVHSKRQLLQILDQFLENLHVTQSSKARDFFAGPYNTVPNDVSGRQATRLDWLDVQARRQALLNAGVTFSNLLLLQAESASMIIYLDTQGSRSDGAFVANENYAREIMELFAMGVDNGYDQTDITQMAPCWTGWVCQFVNTNDVNNWYPTVQPWPPAGTAISNNVGIWRFCFNPGLHGTTNTFNTNYIFFNWNTNGQIIGPKSVPARFGAPWTLNVYTNPGAPGGVLGPLAGNAQNQQGQYGLYIPPQGTFGSTNNIRDGYLIVQHLANLPFTQEFIVAKLCNLFVHDGFPFGPVNGFDFSTNRAEPTNVLGQPRPWYNDSDEGRLMRQCMLAWETNSPKGQLYKVLDVIFKSDIFKTNAYSRKIKTPLEFTISAIRSIKQSTNGSNLAGTWTADTDGYSLNGQRGNGANPMSRMGDFNIYDRETPDGYPEYGQAWVSAGTLTERIRFVQTFLMPTGLLGSFNYSTNKNDNYTTGSPAGNVNRNLSDPLALNTTRLLSGDRNNASVLADMYVNLLFPGEGRANTDLYKRAAEAFLNQSSSGGTSLWPPAQQAEQETRIRGMVAFLLSLQRFNEQ